MLFAALLWLFALSCASMAGYLSIYGLAAIFTASPAVVIAVGICLEAGKVAGVSYIYNYFKESSKVLVTMLSVLIFSLVMFTSWGIFSFFYSTYQTDLLPLSEVNTTLVRYNEEFDQLIARKADMDKQISDMPATYVTAKKRLLEDFNIELQTINPRIEDLRGKILELELNREQRESKLGPLLIIAKKLDWASDDAVFLLAVFIALMLDPLAISLTWAANTAVYTEKQNRKHRKTETTTEPQQEEPVSDTHLLLGDAVPWVGTDPNYARYLRNHKSKQDVKRRAFSDSVDD